MKWLNGTKIRMVLVGVISVLPSVAMGQPGQNGQPNGQPFEQIWSAIEEIWNTLDDLQEQIVQEISDRIAAVQNLQNQIDAIEIQQGPPGPQGEPGPQGPQGEPGTVGGIYEILGLPSTGSSGDTLQPGDAGGRRLYNVGEVELAPNAAIYVKEGCLTVRASSGYGHAISGTNGWSEEGTNIYGGDFSALNSSKGIGVVGNGRAYGGYFTGYNDDLGYGVSGEGSYCGGYFRTYGGNFGVYGVGGSCGGRFDGTDIGVAGNGGIYGGLFRGSTGVSASGDTCDFYAAHGTYESASSIRWKSDIQVINEPLEKILRLRGVYFNWDAEHGGERDVGMIAEEVGEVLPEIVRYEEDGKYASGMDYSRLTPLLVEAVKALRSENQELKQRIEALEKAVPGNQSRQTSALKY